MTEQGGVNLVKLLRDTAEAIRTHVEAQLDLADIFAEYRKTITAAGGDWMALKALVKAQVQDERDESGEGKHVARIIEKADFASSYADMLGLGGMNLNEKNSFSGPLTSDEKISSKPAPAKGSRAMTAPERINPDHLPDAGNMPPPDQPAAMPAVVSTPARRAADASRALTDNRGHMLEDVPASLRRARA